MPYRIWTIAEAEARLSEILRLAEAEGPQHIGVRPSFVVVPTATWYERALTRQPLGVWLIENAPRGMKIEVPDGRRSVRGVPFTGTASDGVPSSSAAAAT